MNNVRQIGLACRQYAIDNSSIFPTGTYDVIAAPLAQNSTDIFNSLTNGNYLSAGKVFLCPSEPSEYKKISQNANPLTPLNSSYAFIMGLDEGASETNPLILDYGLGDSAAAPGAPVKTPTLVSTLVGHYWAKDPTTSSTTFGSPHVGEGGNVFYVGGQAGFKKQVTDATALIGTAGTYLPIQ